MHDVFIHSVKYQLDFRSWVIKLLDIVHIMTCLKYPLKFFITLWNQIATGKTEPDSIDYKKNERFFCFISVNLHVKKFVHESTGTISITTFIIA